MEPKGVDCRQCGHPRHWTSFVDDEGRLSTRCYSCREGRQTGPQTPTAKRAASGMISTAEVNRLLALKAEDEASLADTLPPPPGEPEDGKS